MPKHMQSFNFFFYLEKMKIMKKLQVLYVWVVKNLEIVKSILQNIFNNYNKNENNIDLAKL